MKNLDKQGRFAVACGLGVQPIVVGKAWWQECGAADCIVITTRKQRDEHQYPGSSLLSIQSWTPAYLTTLPTFRMGLPFSCLNLSGNVLTGTPELCLGESRNQAHYHHDRVCGYTYVNTFLHALLSHMPWHFSTSCRYRES